MIGSRIWLITYERGKELALVNIYKYRFIGYRKILCYEILTNKFIN